jgi:hypothetical protein
VFGNSPDFWLNAQRRTDLWQALHSPRELARIERAKPLQSAREAVAPRAMAVRESVGVPGILSEQPKVDRPRSLC